MRKHSVTCNCFACEFDKVITIHTSRHPDPRDPCHVSQWVMDMLDNKAARILQSKEILG